MLNLVNKEYNLLYYSSPRLDLIDLILQEEERSTGSQKLSKIAYISYLRAHRIKPYVTRKIIHKNNQVSLSIRRQNKSKAPDIRIHQN